jgi:DNA-binding NtrC family response regulator
MLLKYSSDGALAGANTSSNGDRQPFLIGVSPEIQALQRLMVEIAPTDIPVLLEGESGVGKEVVALQIHGLSRYRELPFVKLSCSAFLPETLRAHFGDPETGNGQRTADSAGTLFFDEVSELDANSQRYLLHCFPDGNRPQGSRSLADRIISCTTKDLEFEIHEGRLRKE